MTSFYANAAQVNISPFDVQLTLVRQQAGEGPADDTGKPTVVVRRADEMVVHMSPAHAKALLSALYQSITMFEKEMGVIQVPSEHMATFAAMKASGSFH